MNNSVGRISQSGRMCRQNVDEAAGRKFVGDKKVLDRTGRMTVEKRLRDHVGVVGPQYGLHVYIYVLSV